MSENYKNIYKFDVTESGGVTNDLKDGFMKYCGNKTYHLLVEEGGDGYEEHYHLHGIVGSNYGHVSNYRKKEIKPIYVEQKNDSFTAWGVKTKEVKPNNLDGALSYIYKDKRVLSSAGINLEDIKPWKKKPKNPPKCARMKKFKKVPRGDFVNTIVRYIDTNGVKHPNCYMDVRHIIMDMMKENYLFSFDGKTRSMIGEVLQVYDCQAYSLSLLDDLCNYHA